MKTVLVIDDEEDARDLLKYYISQHSELSIIGEASNGIEAVKLVNQLKPDTIFLDIQMPGLNGFEVLARLDELPEVIFSTAYDQYAIKAFEVHAIDYLLKPYGKARFENALSRILNNQEQLIPLAESLLKLENRFPNKIILHKGSRKLVINTSSIIYAEAYGDYTKVFTDKVEYLSLKGISNLIENLNPDSFIRVHRSHFINKNCFVEIKKIERYHYAILADNTSIKISETYLPEIKKMLL
ncbi:response regulator [Subsaximicrobium wynnwilliamsii]|uniref:Response regulator n=1 Tax=Subsaximicrobium wynnwilliamsii TaxID=291179 RepID=A0A5C6ZC44_9FLAO|nr:response regulator [Subsaximicrobium wynnwilliamsii]TXD80936.1 response regulator [Subsaximicrobium wynnwilliamsii]TXD86625.1 response regulator [Subsaximicrobium wynnwilliamsii]TXE00227.1 response regulator [Subsaximicrobium wynnwilliamsii]